MSITFLTDLLFASDFYEWLFFTSWGVIALVSFGLTGVALAIWDGQFIGNVKPTHWISRPKDPSASR